jgi:hypothetical protein
MSGFFFFLGRGFARGERTKLPGSIFYPFLFFFCGEIRSFKCQLDPLLLMLCEDSKLPWLGLRLLPELKCKKCKRKNPNSPTLEWH